MSLVVEAGKDGLSPSGAFDFKMDSSGGSHSGSQAMATSPSMKKSASYPHGLAARNLSLSPSSELDESEDRDVPAGTAKKDPLDFVIDRPKALAEMVKFIRGSQLFKSDAPDREISYRASEAIDRELTRLWVGDLRRTDPQLTAQYQKITMVVLAFMKDKFPTLSGVRERAVLSIAASITDGGGVAYINMTGPVTMGFDSKV